MKFVPEILKNLFVKRPNISERIGRQIPRERGADIRTRMSMLGTNLKRLKAGNLMSNPGVQEGRGREPTEIAEQHRELDRLADLATPQSTDRPPYNPPVKVPQGKSK